MHLVEEHCFGCALVLLFCVGECGRRHWCHIDTGYLIRAAGHKNNGFFQWFAILNDTWVSLSHLLLQFQATDAGDQCVASRKRMRAVSEANGTTVNEYDLRTTPVSSPTEELQKDKRIIEDQV